METFEGRCYVVTGAASGIGLATAKRIIGAGGKVLLVDLDEERLGAAADEMGNGDVAVFPADVSDKAANQGMVSEAVARFGSIDGALLNVGIAGTIKPIAESEVEDFDRIMAVNVRGTWLGLRYLIPQIASSGGGSIVLTASTAGFRAGFPGRAPYVTSKHAVVGLMRAAAAECAAIGIRVNSVSPGGVRTPMTESVKEVMGEEKGNAMLRQFEQTIPLKRIAEPDEIAAVICFLLSDESRYCTGTNMMVDGGLMG